MAKIFLIASIIVGIIIIGVVSSISFSSPNSESITNNLILDLEKNQQQSLDKMEKLSCNCVAFRLDDIPSNFPQVETKVINLFMEKKIPLTLGVMSGNLEDIVINGFSGEGKPRNINFIQEQLQKNGEILEIANHSWRHRNLLAFNLEEQKQIIASSDQEIQEILGTKPKVFIPPFNNFNENIIEILKENGYTHLSSGRNKDFAPFPLNDSDFYRFPATTLTGWQTEEGEWIGVTAQATFAEILTSISENGFAVVMMHTKDYTASENMEYFDVPNQKQFKELESLIKEIQDSGYGIVPVGKINLDS